MSSFKCSHSLNIHFLGQVPSGTELTDKGKMQSFKWLQVIKTCSLSVRMTATEALSCVEILSKAPPESHK